MRPDELMHPGWGHAAGNFRQRDIKYGTAELMVPVVVKPQADKTAATPSPTSI